MKRHTCIICGKKRYEKNMKNVFKSSWACTKNDFDFILDICANDKEIILAQKIIEDLKNLKKIHIQSLLVVTPELTISQVQSLNDYNCEIGAKNEKKF